MPNPAKTGRPNSAADPVRWRFRPNHTITRSAMRGSRRRKPKAIASMKITMARIRKASATSSKRRGKESVAALPPATSSRRGAAAIFGSCRAPARFEFCSRASERSGLNAYPARRAKRSSGPERRSWLRAALSARRICSCFQASATPTCFRAST